MNFRSAVSRLGQLISRGEFVVTAELSSVDSADPQAVVKLAEGLRDRVDAINCTDNPGAHVHLSPLAASRILIDMGLEPIMQLTCRDRNRLALQADILGAAALGVRNLMLMSGDDVSVGDHPEARSIYDIDSLQLVSLARTLRDQGTYLSGRRLEVAPRYLVGAVENPFAPPVEFRPLRLAKKVEAGADFIQTQVIFDLERFRQFMARVQDLGLTERVAIIASVSIPRSARSARFMQLHVPGIVVPDSVVARLERAPESEQAEVGLKIAAEMAAGLRQIPGVRGVHVVAIKWEEGVSRLVEEAGLLPRPGRIDLASVGGA